MNTIRFHNDFRRKREVQAGFTFIEALIIIAFVMLLGGALWSIDRDFSVMSDFVQERLVSQHEIKRALRSLVAETRTASPSSLGSYPIAEASANTFIFYSDSDGDGLKERLRYFLDGFTLKRGVIVPSGQPLIYNEGSEVVSEMVRNVANTTTPIFLYYDNTYDGTTESLVEPIDLLAIRLMKVTIVVDSNGDRAPQPETVTTQISMRNLKDAP